MVDFNKGNWRLDSVSYSIEVICEVTLLTRHLTNSRIMHIFFGRLTISLETSYIAAIHQAQHSI